MRLPPLGARRVDPLRWRRQARRRRSTGAARSAHTIVIAPSNPHRVDRPDPSAARRRRAARRAPRAHVVAMSPIVGGAALKGPADRMLTELGHEPSVVGVARLYAPIAVGPGDRSRRCRPRRRRRGDGDARASSPRRVMSHARGRARELARRRRSRSLSAAESASTVDESGQAVVEVGPRRPGQVDPGSRRRERESGEFVGAAGAVHVPEIGRTGHQPGMRSQRSPIDVCTPVPTLTTRPLPARRRARAHRPRRRRTRSRGSGGRRRAMTGAVPLAAA